MNSPFFARGRKPKSVCSFNLGGRIKNKVLNEGVVKFLVPLEMVFMKARGLNRKSRDTFLNELSGVLLVGLEILIAVSRP